MLTTRWQSISTSQQSNFSYQLNRIDSLRTCGSYRGASALCLETIGLEVVTVLPVSAVSDSASWLAMPKPQTSGLDPVSGKMRGSLRSEQRIGRFTAKHQLVGTAAGIEAQASAPELNLEDTTDYPNIQSHARHRVRGKA